MRNYILFNDINFKLTLVEQKSIIKIYKVMTLQVVMLKW